MTTNTYIDALKAARKASSIFTGFKEKYRAKLIDDKEFLSAREEYNKSCIFRGDTRVAGWGEIVEPGAS